MLVTQRTGNWRILPWLMAAMVLAVAGCSRDDEERSEQRNAVAGPESSVETRLSEVFGDGDAPGMPVGFEAVRFGGPQDTLVAALKASAAREGVPEIEALIGEARGFHALKLEMPGDVHKTLTDRWGPPEERFAEGRAELVWINERTGVEVAIPFEPGTTATSIEIRGLAPLDRIILGSGPQVPEVFDGLEIGMSEAQVRAARPAIEDPARFHDPAWSGVEYGVDIGARGLQAYEVTFWTWHPGKALTRRWGSPLLVGEPRNPQASWRNDETRVRATIHPREGRAVVIRFTRFVPIDEVVQDTGLLAFEGSDWLQQPVRVLREQHPELAWAEGNGRVTIRLPDSEFGTDVVSELLLDDTGLVTELVVRFAGTANPDVKNAIRTRLGALATPVSDAYTVGGRVIRFADKGPAIEVRVQNATP